MGENVEVHCHNHAIQLEKEEFKKLNLTHVIKDIFAACIYKGIKHRKKLKDTVIKERKLHSDDDSSSNDNKDFNNIIDYDINKDVVEGNQQQDSLYEQKNTAITSV